MHPDGHRRRAESLGDGGIRGIRFTQFDPRTAVTTFDMIEPLAKRVETISAGTCRSTCAATRSSTPPTCWDRLPGPIVFDHLGRLPQPAGVDRPGVRDHPRLIDKGRTWVKVSGAYLDTKVGPPTTPT